MPSETPEKREALTTTKVTNILVYVKYIVDCRLPKLIAILLRNSIETLLNDDICLPFYMLIIFLLPFNHPPEPSLKPFLRGDIPLGLQGSVDYKCPLFCT
jgi:hypothetical protein